MLLQRSLLLLSLLSACTDGGDPKDTDTDTTTATTGGESSTGAPTSSGSTSDAATDTSTGEPGDPSSTSGTDESTGTSTGDSDATTGTTGEPMPVTCAGMPVPEPVNTYLDVAELVHVTGEARYFMSMHRYFGENTWDLELDLGAEAPVVGTRMGVPFTGETLLGGAAGGSVDGTLTLELVTVSEDCVLGRVSELAGEIDFLDQELPGGFFAERAEQ